jgi:hypothetical protein
MVAHVVDLDDVGVAQAGDRLGLALEARPLVRPGVGAGEEHLEGDGAIESQMPGLVDDTHAAPAEEGLHVIARDPRQLGARKPRNGDIDIGVGQRRGEQRIEVRLDGAHLPPAAADLRQQLGASAADLLRGTPGIGDLVEQFLHPRFGSHVGAPRGGCVPGLHT